MEVCAGHGLSMGDRERQGPKAENVMCLTWTIFGKKTYFRDLHAIRH
jgi:hypothetical protein